MFPPVADLLDGLRVVALPLVTRFRNIDVREAALMRGPAGWTEFAPFLEYDDRESARWLAAAIEFGWTASPAPLRDRIMVNATVPTIDADDVPALMRRFPGCRTAKVKVAGAGALRDDLARVIAVRRALGPEGRIRIDANAGWTLDEAERALRTLAPVDLEYVEQPCETVPDMVELRRRIADLGVPIAADELVRKSDDPLGVVRAGAADLLVLKAAPLGGIAAALRIAAASGLPCVVSSALDTTIGIGMGAALAASLPELPYDCGLGTAALLGADVTDHSLLPVDGAIEVRRAAPTEAALARQDAGAERTAWWAARIRRCHELIEGLPG